MPMIWRLIRGISWLMVGIGLGRLAIWLCRILAARFLGAETFGEYGLIESTVNMFLGYSALGWGVAISKNLSECFQTDPERAGRILGTVCLISGSLFILLLLLFLGSSNALAMTLSPKESFATSLRIGLILSLIPPCHIANTMLNSFQAFPQSALAYVTQGLLSLALMLSLAPLWGLNGVIVAFGGGLISMFFFQILVIRQLCRRYHIKIRFTGIRQEFNLLWRYNIPTLLGGMMAAPVEWGTRAILLKLGGGLRELGLYMGAYSLCSIMIGASAILQGATLSILSSYTTKEEQMKGIQRNIFIFWGTAVCLIIPLVALSNFVVEFVLGPSYLEAGAILAVLGVAVGIRVFYESLGISLIINDRVWQLTFNRFVDAPIFLLMALFLAPLWHAQGLALAYLLTTATVLFLLYKCTTRELGWERLPAACVGVTLIFLSLAWMVRSVEIFWLAVTATLLLIAVVMVNLIYFGRRFEVFGGATNKISFSLHQG